MTDSPLNVAFIWHMHQPYYKDPFTGDYRLPWVRLHGTKDYLDMAAVLREFPAVRQTFNLVPSLLEQLQDYAENNVRDSFLEMTKKPAASLSEDDRAFLLENFFFANWDMMIRPLPRYCELLEKRGLRTPRGEIRNRARYFTETDFHDLQVLFNLAWIDPHLRQNDPALSELIKKGRGFTEEEKAVVIEKHTEIIRKIVPEYRELWDAGQIELSTSPFYHPILPLLADTHSAKEAMPDARLPRERFRHPEDAAAQIRMGLDYFQKTFGRRPEGMWPSEGSVSEAVLALMKEEGIRWAATDEEVLGASLGRVLRNKTGHIAEPETLYRAYEFSGVNIIFRDHGLSDLIGFVYSGWQPKEAAKNMIDNLIGIRKSLPPKKGGYIVPIILDGENAWEHYRNDGRDFLMHLYEGLSKEERLRTVTVSEHLRENPEAEGLKRLHSGSWIYANFSTWIGHKEDNLSWDYLKDARDALSEFSSRNPGADTGSAWRSIYIAEGSDWNWWYGDEHVTEMQKEFDELYRSNLLKVYDSIGEKPPQRLYVPIAREDRVVAPQKEIRGFITPKMDGQVTGYFEWYQAASLSVGESGGSMHKAESLISEIHYGFDAQNLYIRVDPKIPYAEFPEDSAICINIIRPHEFRLEMPITKQHGAGLFERSGKEWIKRADGMDFAVGEILEAGIPFSLIKAEGGDELNICVTVNRDSLQVERCPWRGLISLTVPTADFEARMWY
ncbi:MAG: glycoside hydrolase family 57 protein [Thermodesulfovibrionales bacterium]|nr:glycoside hydrolase family 57 protein [Thermodesulfovibrionales bacterium]